LKVQNFTKFASAALLTTALSTAMFVTAPVAYADDHAKCQHKIEKAELKLTMPSANTASAVLRLKNSGVI